MILDAENDLQALLFQTVREDAVVADLLESRGQYVLQEPADEFFMSDGDIFHTTCAVVFSSESNRVFGNIFDPCIRDRDPVGIAAEIIDGISKAVEGFLNKGTPVFPVKAVTE